MKKLSTEPVAIGAAINGTASAVIALLATFGLWHPTPDQIGAVLGLLTALEALVAVVVRSKVSPVGVAE